VPVDDDHVFAEPGIQHANCVPELAPRSVGILAEISRGETQMLGNQVRRNLGLPSARREVPIGYQSIDILSSQPCILNRIGSRLQTEAERCSARNPPLRRVAHSCDSVLFFQTHQILQVKSIIFLLEKFQSVLRILNNSNKE
jgi:hypothetical protein